MARIKKEDLDMVFKKYYGFSYKKLGLIEEEAKIKLWEIGVNIEKEIKKMKK